VVLNCWFGVKKASAYEKNAVAVTLTCLFGDNWIEKMHHKSFMWLV